jgi:hypothetical protein
LKNNIPENLQSDNMKFGISILLTALLSYVAGLYLPWWTIAVVALLVAVLIPQPPLRSFLAGFIALFLLWWVLSFSISSGNGHLLAKKTALMVLKSPSPKLLTLLAAFLGATVAGFGALTGSYFKKMISKPGDGLLSGQP